MLACLSGTHTHLNTPAPGPTPTLGHAMLPTTDLQLLAWPQGLSAPGCRLLRAWPSGSLVAVLAMSPLFLSVPCSVCKSRSCSGLLPGVGQASPVSGEHVVPLRRALGPQRAGPGHPAPHGAIWHLQEHGVASPFCFGPAGLSLSQRGNMTSWVPTPRTP